MEKKEKTKSMVNVKSGQATCRNPAEAGRDRDKMEGFVEDPMDQQMTRPRSYPRTRAFSWLPHSLVPGLSRVGWTRKGVAVTESVVLVTI